MASIGPTVSAVVLLTPQHFSYFRESLVPNLGAMTTPYDELLVVASGVSRRITKLVEKSLDSLVMHRIKRVVRVPLGSVGANRNHGLNRATSDFVTFLDSDDLYSPDYCAFIKAAHHRQSFDILLHSFLPLARGDETVPCFQPIGPAALPAFLSNADFIAKPIDDWGVDPRTLSSTSLSPKSAEHLEPIHQGHMTVSKSLPLRFHEDPVARNEDGVFLQQCLAKGFQIHYYPLKLSAYRLHSSANPMRYRILRRINGVPRAWFRNTS